MSKTLKYDRSERDNRDGSERGGWLGRLPKNGAYHAVRPARFDLADPVPADKVVMPPETARWLAWPSKVVRRGDR